MENGSDSYDNVRQDISSTQSTLPSVSSVPPNSIEPFVSATPPNSIQVTATPPNSIEHPVSAAPPNSIKHPVSAAPPNSNATVDQNETPDAPPAYSSIEPPPPYSNPSQYPTTLGIPYLQNYPRGNPATGRPPHGQHYYPPLGFVQPQGPKPHHQQHQQHVQQQQQQRVITMDNRDCQPASAVAPVSMTGAIILACFVTWFCAYVCGLMALRMAWAGRQLAEVGETMRAIRMRRASYCFSITGIIFGLIIIIVLVCVLTTSKSTSSSDHQEVPSKTTCRRIFLSYTCS